MMQKSFSFEDILNQIPGHVYWKDVEGKIINCNLRQAQTLGFNKVEDIINKTDVDLYGKEIWQKIRDNDCEIMRTKKSQIIEEAVVFNGKKVTYISHKSPLLDEHGNVIGIFGVSIDITKQKLKEEQLNFENEFNALTIENIIAKMPGHVYWKDTNGIYLGCNDKQVHSLGLHDTSEIIGKIDYDLPWGKKAAKKIIEHDQKIINTGIAKIVEEPVTIQKKDYVFLSHKSPLKDKTGRILGMVGVSIDITRQKELESNLYNQTQELQEALTEKQRFLNNLSHEIRTPLHVIKAISDELFENLPHLSEEEAQSFLQTLVENNNRLMKLLTNILDVAKKQKKKGLDLQKSNIVDIVKECINEVKQIAHVTLKTTCDKIDINCDEIKISQVIRNLLDNAIKYGEKSEIIIEIEKDTDKVLISVKDKGVGILEDERIKIFEPFFQSTQTRTNSGGTGLGLSICKEIILAHKGKIWVDNNTNDITSINIELPYNL
jgi:two-component system aerobic respiration control sensor histidine kinase ArcB